MRRAVMAVALCALILAHSGLADVLVHSDGTFDEANWAPELMLRGLPNGTGEGTAEQVLEGGHPGAYWRVYLLRDPDTAGNDNSARMASYNIEPLSNSEQGGYQACITGEIESVDISVEGYQTTGGSGGTVAPTLKQGGVKYIASGISMPEMDWAEKAFTGLTANSFFPIGSPGVHPDFSMNGAPITFGFDYLISTPSELTVTRTAGFDNWKLAVNYTPLPFFINEGLNDAWFNAATVGQGFFFNVFPDLELIFLAWFTYDTQRPGEEVAANLGEPGHRWLTALGPFSGDTAILDVELTSGGIFDTGDPPVVQVPGYGTITIKFHGCRCATLTYDIPSLGLARTMPVQRIVDDNVPLCEALNADLAMQAN